MQRAPLDRSMAGDSWGHIDLFCGPGGFACGFEAAGFRTLVGLDHHGPSIATFGRNHPNAALIHGDIREVEVGRLREAVGGQDAHVITAGVPCEGFSMSNRNRGRFVDERNFLFLEFLRVAEAFRPPYVVLENVSALTRHEEGFFKREIENGLRDIGYRVESRVLDALAFGVPQRRRRVFFVGRLQGWSFEWPKPSHGDAVGLIRPPTVWEAIGDLAPLGSDEVTDKYGQSPLSEYAARLRGDADRVTNHQSPKHPPATVARIAATMPGKPMYASFRQRIRLDPDRPSPTVVSGGIRPQFHYGHPTQPRGLSVRERARLQSFPDSYYFAGGIVQGRVQTGDAVPPLVACALAKGIAAGLAAGAGADTSSNAAPARAVELFPVAPV
jgi:DNA (cytosine-5)-methyltransferase 1